MHRLIVILCTFILLGGLSSAEQAETPLSIKILADQEEYDWATEHFYAHGNVRVTYGETLLTADSVSGNPFTGEMHAAGNVTFENGTRTLTGESFSYNYKTMTGLAGNASAVIDSLYFHGEELRSEPGKYTLTRSRFTTCDAENPHYYMSAREMEVVPGKKLIAHDIAIYVYGNKLLSLPKYSISLDKKGKTSHFKLPEFGVSGRYGVFAGYDFDLSSGPGTIGQFGARVSTKQVFQGGLDYERIAGRPIFIRAGYREPYYGGVKSDTLLTRMPEVGIRIGSKNAYEAYSASRESLDLARGFTDPRRLSSPDFRGMNIIGEIGVGKFVENPGSISSKRLDTRLEAWMNPMPIAQKTVLSPGISARFSHYDTGEDYSAIGFRLGVGQMFGSQSYGSLTYFANSIHGSTPFEFDRVELSNELAGKVGFPVGSFFLEVGGRYDLSGGRLYDSEISIAKTLHCLEPKLTWRNRFQQISMDVRVLGF